MVLKQQFYFVLLLCSTFFALGNRVLFRTMSIGNIMVDIDQYDSFDGVMQKIADRTKWSVGTFEIMFQNRGLTEESFDLWKKENLIGSYGSIGGILFRKNAEPKKQQLVVQDSPVGELTENKHVKTDTIILQVDDKKFEVTISIDEVVSTGEVNTGQGA